MSGEYVGPSEELQESAKNFWRSNGQLQLIRGNENWVYEQEGTELIFRFTANYHRSEQNLLAELDWIHFLEQKKCSVVSPVYSHQHKLVHALSEMWCVVVFKKASGRALKEAEDFSVELMFNWGKTIGQMHKHTKEYLSPVIARNDWDKDDGFELALKMIPILGEEHFVVKTFLSIVEQIRKLPKNKDTFGLIHADIHNGNFFVTPDNQLTVFDFDDAIYAYFLFDLAVPLEMMEIVYRSGRWSKNLRVHQDVFLQGYNSENTIPSLTNESLELFVCYRCAHLYLWATSRIHMKRTNDPAAFETMMNSCEQYLLNK